MCRVCRKSQRILVIVVVCECLLIPSIYVTHIHIKERKCVTTQTTTTNNKIYPVNYSFGLFCKTTFLRLLYRCFSNSFDDHIEQEEECCSCYAVQVEQLKRFRERDYTKQRQCKRKNTGWTRKGVLRDQGEYRYILTLHYCILHRLCLLLHHTVHTNTNILTKEISKKKRRYGIK